MAALRVFLSSTALDLAAHRQVADDTLLRLQQQSVAMERFGALPGTPVEECERLAATCDVLVCIVAHRYGFEPEPGRGSITLREVEAARQVGKPVYAWIVDDKHPWTEVKEQDRLTQPEILANPDKQQEVIAALQGLLSFKAWLRANVTVDTFTTPDDLGRKIATALAQVQPPSAASAYSAPRAPELRIVHALQPAPHFSGRAALVATLGAWVDDIASPDRIHALVAAGGTGKTAIVEQVLRGLQARWPRPGAGHVLVWSFYERPDADAFLRECGQLFLGEPDDAPPGGRLERLQRGLRNGQPHLLVMDGLERVQAEAGSACGLGRVRGELEDTSLRLLLQAIAAGLGRTRALLTSRFAMTDLRGWLHAGAVETALDDLPADAAREVLRGWGVQGPDAALDAVAAQVGRHALSVAVIGSYLKSFEVGRIEAAAHFDLDTVAGDDPKAAKLARVLAFYAEKLPAEERELLTRLAVFPRGITLELFGVLLDAGGAVAGLLVNARPALPHLLARLVERGLAFRYTQPDQKTLTWTAHPFVRERFASLLACPASEVFGAVAERLGRGLEARPENKPQDVALLDRYEQLIEATRLAGRVQEAFELYWYGLGYFAHLGKLLGEYARGYRILRSFFANSGDLNQFGYGLRIHDQSLGLNEFALTCRYLGRLHEALAARAEVDERDRLLGGDLSTSLLRLNTCELACDLGQIKLAKAAAQSALDEAKCSKSVNPEGRHLGSPLAYRAYAAHLSGDVDAAHADFAAATLLEDEPLLYSNRGLHHARNYLDHGDFSACRTIVKAGLVICRRYGRNFELPGWHALLARLALAEGEDPQPHIAEIRAWTSRSGDMEWIIEAHLLSARHALARQDLSTALAEAEDGLRQARLCGYRLKEIELLVTFSAIRRAWPDAQAALVAARQALDLATAPDCGYAWGEADAAQAWGLAFVALGQPEPACRAFRQALAVRERIGHPELQATRDALARLGE